MDCIKQELSSLNLMTRCHFIRLWSADYITIDGMDEQLIMTIQSQSHITYANLNRSSTQGAQEEFIFSIANVIYLFNIIIIIYICIYVLYIFIFYFSFLYKAFLFEK